MKVILFNGSPHARGNTYDCLGIVDKEIKAAGIETELIQLAPLKIQPCKACFKCAKMQNYRCGGYDDDGLNEVIAKIFAADGIVIGSPTWFANVTGHVKNLIDRAGIVARVNKENPLDRKVGAAVVAVRRAGAVQAFDAINRFYQINGMIMPGGTYWGIAYGREPGDCLKDKEGVDTFTTLGKNIAWLLKKLAG